nr:SURF1 family protein [Parahaliea mediterranea]
MAFAGFLALGNWQLERRVWKLDLIERVNARVDAPAVTAPDRARFTPEHDEYRHVSVRGRFLAGRDTRVASATELGTGYWVLTPLSRIDGSLVLINRGFVGQGVEPAPVPAGEVRVEGLLRLSEPGGGVLRENEPGADRWYSRDVDALAAHLRLDDVAPYFIDAHAGAPGSPGGDGPVGGLTVISFHNSHLVYALTWYGLAAMVIGAAVVVIREERRRGAGAS